VNIILMTKQNQTMVDLTTIESLKDGGLKKESSYHNKQVHFMILSHLNPFDFFANYLNYESGFLEI
jgi:hypothetical protein